MQLPLQASRGSRHQREWSTKLLTGAGEAEQTQLRSDEVLEQLTRMLNDDLFLRSERLSRFLCLIVQESLERRERALNQYAVALAVFDKPPSFDPNVDPVVRVEAGRLRSKIREYYATSGQKDDVYIGMEKPGYRPVFRRRPPDEFYVAKSET